MRKICIINQKGGVGKTTTTINLAYGLANKKRRVLIVDLDAQGNISSSLNIKGEKSVYDIVVKNANPKNCIVNVTKNLDIISSDSSLAEAEMVMAGKQQRETILKRKLDDLEDDYDYILLDCPPSLSLLNQNALLFAEEAFVPVATDHLSFLGLKQMSREIEQLNELFDHDLQIGAVIPTMFDKRRKSSRAILDKLNTEFNGVVMPFIRTNCKLAEAPAKGKSIYEYAKNSNGARDYTELVQAVLQKEW
jgi:chromosome partitioning protein